jgi:O-antigen/teichoic acid export membrane protein
MAQEGNEFEEFWAALARSMLVRVLVSGFVAAVVAIGVGFSTQTAYAEVAILASAMAVATSLSGPIDSVQNAARHRVTVALHQAASAWLRVAFSVIFIIAFGATASSTLAGYIAAALVVVVSQWLFFQRQIRASALREVDSKVTQAWHARIERYAWPFSICWIPYWIQSAAERWSLDIYGNLTDVGQYAVLAQLGYAPIVLLTSVVVQTITPVIFERLGSGEKEAQVADAQRLLRQLLLSSSVLTVFMTVAAVLFGRQLILFVATAAYLPIAKLLPLAVLSAGIFATAQIATISILGADTKLLLPPKICMPLLGAMLSVVGAWHLGVLGVVLANLGTSILYCCWILAIQPGEKQTVAPAAVLQPIAK